MQTCTPAIVYFILATFICCIASVINTIINKTPDISGPISQLSSICLYSICLAMICTLSPVISWIIVLIFICSNLISICSTSYALTNVYKIQ